MGHPSGTAFFFVAKDVILQPDVGPSGFWGGVPVPKCYSKGRQNLLVAYVR